MSSWEKLHRDLDFAVEQGTLKSGVRLVWKLVRGCLEDQRCNEVVENGQAALEMLQEERSEKANSDKGVKKKGGKGRLYPALSDLEESEGSESEDLQSIIEQMDKITIRKKKRKT